MNYKTIIQTPAKGRKGKKNPDLSDPGSIV